METSFTFPEWLRAMGLTQQEAADRLGYKRAYIKRLAANPAAPEFLKMTDNVKKRCEKVAKERLKEIAPFASEDVISKPTLEDIALDGS